MFIHRKFSSEKVQVCLEKAPVESIDITKQLNFMIFEAVAKTTVSCLAAGIPSSHMLLVDISSLR